jgi:hypothetical protein
VRAIGDRWGIVLLWAALAGALAVLATRVRDWFVMTDELLYERLAISIARTHVPLPRVHGELVPSVNQLYPLLVSPAFGDGLVPHSLHTAHLLNAIVMSSACIPAFLLVRRVSRRTLPAYVVAALTVVTPWIVLSSFLLTEVAAYPAFLWAFLGLLAATDNPSPRNDVLALLGLGLAVLARTQFTVLLVVFPLALLLVEGRAVLARHRVLVWAYAALLAGFVVLLVVGRTASVLGTYGSTVRGNLLPSDSGRSFAEHAAQLALGLGILPFVVGTAWLLANARRRDPFASLASVTVIALIAEVTLFDLRFGNGIVRDRYLFYVAPVVLAGFVCALVDARPPRWSLVVPGIVVALGFGLARLPHFDKVNADAPVSNLDGFLLRAAHSLAGARAALVLLTIAAVLLYVVAARSRLALGLALLALAALPAQSAYAWTQLLRHDGTSGRPLTHVDGGSLDWIDRTAGSHAGVTMLPYQTIPGVYWASVGSWWDLEFWNAAVDRGAYALGEYESTPSTFPKLGIQFDPRTGAANISPSRYAVMSTKESRFRISGRALAQQFDFLLVDAGRHWRTDWLTFGLTDDGWTRPHGTARIRIFALPGQRRAILRTLTLAVRPPEGAQGTNVSARSNRGEWQYDGRATGTVSGSLQVCVPPRGFSDVRVSTNQSGPVYGDQSSEATYGLQRTQGVFLSAISLADELGGTC